MRRDIAFPAAVAVVVLISLIILGGCGAGSNPIAPPENLSGTVAFGDKSGVVEMEFSDSARSLSTDVVSRALFDISGSIRYEGVTFALTGSYDDSYGSVSAFATATVGSDTVTFEINGTYTGADGFSGTITRSINGGASETGAVSATAATDTEVDSVQYFLGKFGGSVYGTWNLAVLDGRAIGSYGGEASGILTGTVSSGEVDLAILETNWTSIGTARGIVDTGTMGGTWTAGEDTGYWTGKEADANFDPVDPDVADPAIYRLGLIFQATEQGMDSVDTESSVQLVVETGAYGHEKATYTFTDFIDDVTGITVTSGVIVIDNMNAAGSSYDLNATTNLAYSAAFPVYTEVFFDLDVDETAETMTGTFTVNGSGDYVDDFKALYF